ncbi:hypothetical protein C8Q74DRAFT_1265643, partial [Fomes fomentarius]
MVLYEYFVTLGSEVSLFWKGNITAARILFFSNRYLPLVVNGPLWNILQLSPPFVNCIVGYYAWSILDVIQFPLWGLISTLRAYTLNERRKMVPALVFILNCIPFAVNILRVYFAHPSIDPVEGCRQDVYLPAWFSVRVWVIASRVALITADGIVVALTWKATWSTARLHRSLHVGHRSSFACLLLRDGEYILVLRW